MLMARYFFCCVGVAGGVGVSGCWCLLSGGWVVLVMVPLGRVAYVTTGAMPRQLGVYIRIIVPVCFHSFCS
jgi:hypothetical protein